MSENSPTPKPPENQPAQPGSSSSVPPAPEKKNNGETRRKLNSPRFIWPAAIALAVIFYFGLGYIVDVFTHESTDDAFIAGHVVSIAPRIYGQVRAVLVLDNQLVHSNDLLVEMDPSDYATTLAQKRAAQTASEANYEAARAGYDLMSVKVATAEATVRESQADADAAEATAVRAGADFARAADLLKQQTVSAQEYDQAKAADEEAKANLNSARQKTLSDQSKVTEAKAQMAAAKAEASSVLASAGRTQTEVDSAKLDLSYTKIYAPCDGRVTRKQVEPGDYLQTGQTIMAIVPDEVWVVANFKETQLKNMHPGQRVMVAIDALGGREFRAHVDSVQAGSGAAFSLLPPENATGNFVKVVQRVPVKIIFDQPLPADHVIGPGLSVTPSVLVSSFAVPDWVVAVLAALLALLAAGIFKWLLNRKATGAAANGN